MTLAHWLKSLWDPTAELVALAEQEHPDEADPNHLLQKLQFQLNRRLGSPYAGNSPSFFKGHGMDLLHLREYQPGDDIRKIDWNVFARTNEPHIKEHFEDKQLAFWLFIDRTPSMQFGQTQSKQQYAKQLAGLIALLALKHSHKVGAILWDGSPTPKIFQPSASFTHVQWLLHEMEQPLSETHSPDQPLVFPSLAGMIKNHAMVFLLSDFDFLMTLPESRPLLAELHKKQDLYHLLLVDPVEEALVYKRGWLPMTDMAQQKTIWVNTSSRWMRKAYLQQMDDMLTEKQTILSQLGHTLRIKTDQPPLDIVTTLVKAS